MVIVGSRERDAQTAVVRTMATHQERSVALDDLRTNGLAAVQRQTGLGEP